MTTASLKQIKAAGWMKEANHIGGKWVPADDGRVYEVEDPATETRIGEIAWSGAVETRRAIDAAHTAFASWAMTTAAERAAFLSRMAQIVRDNLDMLAAMLTFKQGKPLAEVRTEMKLGADYLQWFAEEARRINGEIIPSPWKDRQILVTREPVGVVGAISPWNFPFSMLSRKVAPALAAGCTIVIKPSEFTLYCGLLYAVLAEMAGLPSSVVNVVTGDGAAVGGELSANPLVRKITFTGSTRVGKLLYSQSAETIKALPGTRRQRAHDRLRRCRPRSRGRERRRRQVP